MGDCRKSGRFCTGKIAIPLHTFLKKSSKFLYKIIEKSYWLYGINALYFKYQREGKPPKGFKKIPKLFKKSCWLSLKALVKLKYNKGKNPHTRK